MADENDLARLWAGERDLTHCDFQGAHLNGQDLRGRDFSGANLNGAQLIGSDLRNSKFDRTKMVRIDLSGANCSGAKFIGVGFLRAILKESVLLEAKFTRCSFSQMNFDGLDIRNVSFYGSRFAEAVSFVDTKFDESTDFSEVNAMRSLSRYEVFKYHSYSNGKFNRISDDNVVSPDGSGPDNTDSSKYNMPSGVEVAIINNVDGVRLLSQQLSISISEHIRDLSSERPNDPDRLKVYDKYISLLEEIQKGLQEISFLLSGVPEGEVSSELAKSAEIIQNLSAKISKYANENADKILSTTMIGVSSAFFTLCGAAPQLGFAVATAIYGGSAVVKAAGAIIGAAKEKQG
jgi:uncharacterized protein YjbI with pentapeptide repeats/multidrug transporter EmrE-like cation transporter